MIGFTAIVSKKNIFNEFILSKNKVLRFENDFIFETIKNGNYLFSRYTNKKFSKDKVFLEDHDCIIGIEGVVLNLNDLKIKNQEDDTFLLFKSLFKKHDKEFIKMLRGDFSGFILQKSENSLFVFTNQTGSKRIFYYHQDDIFIFSSRLTEISAILKRLNIKRSLNTEAAYFMLTCGFMLEENTYIEKVKRLLPGQYLVFQNDKITINEYFHLKNIQKTTDSQPQIIERMDELFATAIKREYDKDLEYGYEHIATLSGGLDSRMAVLMAHKLGYQAQLNFTFSQTDYLDERIAKKIATDHHHDFLFIALDGGNFLKNIEKNVYINDGLVSYSGAAHALHAVERINFQNFGLAHTGLIGDAVIGSFVTKPFPIKSSYTDGMFSTKYADRVRDAINLIIDKYPSEELYKFYGRGFLGAMNGYYSFELVSQGVSPFLDIDFLSYCISIPEDLKFKQQIYLDWIKHKHREFADYPWEKTGISPLLSNSYLKYFKIAYYKRMSLKFFDKLSGSLRSGMNPMDFWLKENTSLKPVIEKYFSDQIGNLQSNEGLFKDCTHLYESGNISEKLQVLTVLAAVKLHDIEV